MNDFWEKMVITNEKKIIDKNNLTTTENGAVAYNSTRNMCLDAFGSLGGMRKSSDEDIIRTFKNAFYEDRKLAMRMLFYFRDIRGGQGQRRVFRTIIKWLANNYKECVENNLDNILFYGRGDDYLCLLDTPVADSVNKYIKNKLLEDVSNMNNCREVSLLAKWLPSINTSSCETRKNAYKLINAWGWEPKNYRKILSALRAYIDVTERKMSSNSWEDINYSTVPSKASINYSNAFFAHDSKRYSKYLSDLNIGKSKVNAKALFPVDIIHKIYSNNNFYRPSDKDRILWDSMWKALPNYFEGKNETGICVCDTSGSMYGTPLEVALSLGMYCADKCTGPFANKFITFSSNPRLVEFKGNDIYEKVRNVVPIIENTNIEKVFNLILDTALRNNCKNEDIPSKVYIISDMQFDSAQGYRYRRNVPFMKIMRDKFEHAGYTLPSLIYWNVRASKCGMFHETVGGENCAMVSGYSPSLFKSIIEGTIYEETIDNNGNVRVKETIDPIIVMLTTLNNERYDRVVV